MKLFLILIRYKIYRKKKILEVVEFIVERMYNKNRVISRMMFRRDFVNIKEVFGVVCIFKEKIIDFIIIVV